MIFSSPMEAGKWIRVYKTFKFDEKLLDNDKSTTKFIDSKYYWIEFVATKACSFKIKKPKLEVGNVPSGWSSSPYDIDYGDI
jgi:uncharacterized membrane protein